MEPLVCQEGYEKVAGECLPINIKIKEGITAESDVAIRRVLGYIKEAQFKASTAYSIEHFPLSSAEFRRGYESGHHDACHKLRHILMESGYYSDEI